MFAYTSASTCRSSQLHLDLSGTEHQEAGATATWSCLQTSADAWEYLRAGRVNAGLDLDRFRPQRTFFWCIGMNFFIGVAKLRAARCCGRGGGGFRRDLRTPIVALSLRTTRRPRLVATARRSTTTSVRTCVGGDGAPPRPHQSLHTNALRRGAGDAHRLLRRIARNHPLRCKQESGT
ncbi:methylmalonyl-CoA mutase family protein, partial [Nonomuraea dietziae]|uniref:methylmalonyl-CoA mutase family protein n=1 Tax=Nonomuraea dietziae TaxID=65515 RepID=UPI0031D3E3BD